MTRRLPGPAFAHRRRSGALRAIGVLKRVKETPSTAANEGSLEPRPARTRRPRRGRLRWSVSRASLGTVAARRGDRFQGSVRTVDPATRMEPPRCTPATHQRSRARSNARTPVRRRSTRPLAVNMVCASALSSDHRPRPARGSHQGRMTTQDTPTRGDQGGSQYPCSHAPRRMDLSVIGAEFRVGRVSPREA